MTKISFFKFSKLELSGGCENLMIENANELLNRYDDLEVNFVTIDLSSHWIYIILMSIYYLKPFKSTIRETNNSVLKKLNPRIQYINCKKFSELKLELSKADYIYSKNEILELIILNCFVGFKYLSRVILSHHTTLYFNHVSTIQDKLHNFLYTGLIYKILVKKIYKHHVFTDQDKQILSKKLNLDNVYKIIRPYIIENSNFTLTPAAQLSVLFLGRLNKAKGVDILSSIIKELNIENKNNFIFNIAGVGEKKYENIISDLALKSNNVNYYGYIDNEKISFLYENSDIVIMPSLYETTGAMIFEGAKYGSLPIISNLPGPKEYIIDGYNGFICDLNKNEFIDCLKSCLKLKNETPSKLLQMINNNTNVISTKNNPDKIYETFYKLFT